MKINVYLSSAGVLQAAKGEIPYPYQFSIRVEGCSLYKEPPDDGSLLGCLEVADNFNLTDAIAFRKKALEKDLQDLRANAYVAEQAIQQEINDLLMLEHNQ